MFGSLPSQSKCTMSSKGSGSTRTPSRFSRYAKAPIRALCKVRDFYVNGMTGLAERASNRGVRVPAGAVSARPRSYAFHPARASSGEDDMRELVRAASQGSLGSLNLNGLKSSNDVVPRSQSVAIGRIDEDEPCDFSGDAMVGMDHMMYPRSMSCAVVSKSRLGVVA